MAKGYWVVSYRNDSDKESMKAYGALVGGVLAKYEGKRLVAGVPAEVHDAGEIKRTVVIEFPSLENAKAAYNCEEYTKAKEALGTIIQRDFRIVEGFE
ncbi:MAG TPA: DUF1330 domain-containing protein [Granulicella sp.]